MLRRGRVQGRDLCQPPGQPVRRERQPLLVSTTQLGGCLPRLHDSYLSLPVLAHLWLARILTGSFLSGLLPEAQQPAFLARR